jgi:hypothetical protein
MPDGQRAEDRWNSFAHVPDNAVTFELNGHYVNPFQPYDDSTES